MALSGARERWAAYKLNFPEQVAAFEKQNEDVIEKSHELESEDPSGEEAAAYMEDALKSLRYAIASSNSSRELGGTAVALGYTIQALGGQFGLQLQGPKANMTEQVAQNEEAFSTLAKEILCKYGGSSLLEPEARLALLTLSCIGSVHTRNACAERLRKEEKAPPLAAPTPSAPRADNVQTSVGPFEE